MRYITGILILITLSISSVSAFAFANMDHHTDTYRECPVASVMRFDCQDMSAQRGGHIGLLSGLTRGVIASAVVAIAVLIVWVVRTRMNIWSRPPTYYYRAVVRSTDGDFTVFDYTVRLFRNGILHPKIY